MHISRLPSGAGSGEIHGASILISTNDDTLINEMVDLKKDDIVIKSARFTSAKTVVFEDILEAGSYTATCGENSKTVTVTDTDVIRKNTVEGEIYIAQFELTLGNTYSFGGYDWTAAEDCGSYYVLQSQGVTADTWNNLFNSATTNQDGVDCHTRNTVLNTLYSDISYAEKTGASYGSGLFLVSKEKCGGNTTASPQPSSGLYANAHTISAKKYSDLSATYNYSLLGTNYDNTHSYCLASDAHIYVGNVGTKSNKLVIAPAFNLDKTKVRLEGSNDIVAIDAPERLYLYDLGNECVDVTGGWIGRAQWTETGGGSLTKGSTSMTIYGSSNTWSYTAVTSNSIDTTGFSKLYARAKANKECHNITLRLGQESTNDSQSTELFGFNSNFSVRKKELVDNEKRFLSVMAYAVTTIEVDKIYLEK